MTPTIEASRPQEALRQDARPSTGSTSSPSAGQVVAVLGPNGAGKTHVRPRGRHAAAPRRGDAAGRRARRPHASPRRCAASIGLAGQFAAVEPAMTGRENLEHGRPPVRAQPARGQGAAPPPCSTQLGLATRPTGSCGPTPAACAAGSTSARASSVRPRLLLLDEPTTGLDPRSRIELWDAIRALVESGTDVLLTTQYLDEADQLADQIVIVDHGRAIAAGTPAELKRRIGGDVIEIHVRDRAPTSPRRRRGSSARLDGGTPRRSTTPTRRVTRARRTPAATGLTRGRAAPSSAAGHRRSTTSPCAARRSTRCSSPSPAMRVATTTRSARPRPDASKGDPMTTIAAAPADVDRLARSTAAVTAPRAAPLSCARRS